VPAAFEARYVRLLHSRCLRERLLGPATAQSQHSETSSVRVVLSGNDSTPFLDLRPVVRVTFFFLHHIVDVHEAFG
jgi:hypothetical protein